MGNSIDLYVHLKLFYLTINLNLKKTTFFNLQQIFNRCKSLKFLGRLYKAFGVLTYNEQLETKITFTDNLTASDNSKELCYGRLWKRKEFKNILYTKKLIS